MRTEENVEAMQTLAEEARCAGLRIGLVPTMGALHEGHLSLVKRARETCDWVVVSGFVNPTQFGPDEDIDRYPRQPEADADQVESLGVDVFFTPSIEGMYPDGVDESLTWVEVDELDQHLCGAFRPGHFRGVTTVVTKLFHVVRPHVAVFGQKDAQQLVIIRKMVKDLLLDVSIEVVPIVREEDGLALSSRNAYLSDEERKEAVVLSQAVFEAKSLLQNGELGVEGIVEAMQNKLSQADKAQVEYVELVDQESLAPVDTLTPGQQVIAAVAVYFGDTRLIDNAFATVRSQE